MDRDALDPIAIAARETAQFHAFHLGSGNPRPVDAWREVESFEWWLQRALEAAGKAEPIASASAEWLLDNAFQVQRAVLLIKQDLPAGFYRRLRPLAAGPTKGEPLVLSLAHDLLHATHFQISRQAVLVYLESYQEHLPLDIAELWSLPVMLRIACLERLAAGIGEIFPEVPSPVPTSESCRQFLGDADADHSVSRSIASLGVVSSITWKQVFDSASLVERKLSEDPCGVYSFMDFETRDGYRKAVERLAERCDLGEIAVADHAVTLAGRSKSKPACHVGYWLAGEGKIELEREIGARPPAAVRLVRLLRRNPGAVYTLALFLLGLAGLAAPAAFLAMEGADPLQWIVGIGLSILPATVISITLVNWLVTLGVPPQRLPKLDFANVIDPAWPTLVVVPVIVKEVAEVPALIGRLESHRLSNPTAHGFVLLSDPADSACECLDSDAEIETALQKGLEALNHRYGKSAVDGPFCLLHRRRRFNPAQNCWMAWERKRGKLEEFNKFLISGESGAFPVQVGPVHRLPGARFVVTADADTRLPPGTVARMAATLAHPLNRPQFDRQGRVISGYTVLQPRVEIAPQGNDSLFARLFGGDTAIDIYSRAVSDVYQDLVGTGNYVGKGIYDVAGFTQSLEGRVPENSLLSHDLWEGLHGRAGLVSDIIVYESFPASYGEYIRRWNRWVRGDWQLLPWLFPRVPGPAGTRLSNRLSLFDRLRLWDNMRRSLIPASVLALLLGGWFFLPGHPIFWTLFAVAAPGAYLFTDLVTGLARGRRRGVLTGTLHELGEHIGRWTMSLVFLITDTVAALHAILVTLLRLGKGRMLLEWTSAAHVSIQIGKEDMRKEHWRSMWVSPVAAVTLAIPLISQPHIFSVAAPLLCLWLAAPEIAFRTGRNRMPKVQVLDDDARSYLRLIARRGWLFFETYVRPQDNWLPPDNHQEAPISATAHRTSPTNIGMMVLAALAAWRLGHIGTAELIVRMREMLDTLDRLERWRGHILNWYHTTTLAPLEPRYVSTVDSGNLAVSLITLAKGCEEVAGQRAFDASQWQGLTDCLALLGEAMDSAAPADSSDSRKLLDKLQTEVRTGSAQPSDWLASLERCETQFGEIRKELLAFLDSSPQSSPESLRDLRNWLERSEHHLHVMRRDLETALPWLPRLAAAPPGSKELAAQVATILTTGKSLRDSGKIARATESVLAAAQAQDISEESRRWLASLAKDIDQGLAQWRQMELQLADVAHRAASFADGMDFEPLYDPDQRLFHIGYDLSADRIDQHHYDLLASEARLASFFAIAKRDVPPEHWFQLGRPIVKRRRELALVSWNGSMFEYLMPCLFLRSEPGTLLGESDQSSVDMQRRYGAANGVPWGISESGYASVGTDNAWRYRAFGVPELGLRRGLGEDMVIAPYASVLALAVKPQDAVANMRAMAGLGALGQCGFFEALDFTRSRNIEGQNCALVRSYMAHHHGMSIAAIGNALFDNMFVSWFHADPRVQTVELLLHERIPWELPPEIERIEPRTTPTQNVAAAPRPQPWKPQVVGPAPALHVLGNGRLATTIGEDGSGDLRWKDYSLTRPGEAQGGNGHFIYLRDVDSGKIWSATSAPLGTGSDSYTICHAHKVEFHCRMDEISTALEIAVAPAEDVEIRRIRLVNSSSRERKVEVASLAEIALAPSSDYLRHPAFAKLFVTVEARAPLGALLFQRRAREPLEASPALVQRLIGLGETIRMTGWEVTRQATRQRHEDVSYFPRFSGSISQCPSYPLDPVAAFRAEATLPPYSEAELAIITTVGSSADDALELARRYGSLASLDWAEQDAALRTARDLHDIGLLPNRLADAQVLYSSLLNRAGPRKSDLGLGMASRDGLWAVGLSGDLPILLVYIDDGFDVAEARFLLAAHRLWRRRGSHIDMVLLHSGMPGYIEPLRERLIDLLRDTGNHELLAERGGIHIFGHNKLESGPLSALRRAAAIYLVDGAGPISSQVAEQICEPVVSPPFMANGGTVPPPPEPQSTKELRFSNGFGGFTDDGDYSIELPKGRKTPAPWANLLANREFGAIVTEAGLGWTFAGNSGENRLTPWYNDPLADPQGEAVYLRDEDTGDVWSISPLPAGDAATCHVEHRCGSSVWKRESSGLVQEMTCLVASDEPVKIVRIKLSDRSGTRRRITATFFADWLLGATAGEPGPFRRSWYAPGCHAILAQNQWNRDFAGWTAFLTATLPPHSLTTSRREFLGPKLDWGRPHGLTVWDLGDRAENFGADSAAAFQVHIDIDPLDSCEFAFIIGQADGEDAAEELIRRWQDSAQAGIASTRIEKEWASRLGTVQATTPDPAFDLMVNRWLPYQAISSRLFARAGFYQAGGAYGFRDQLQDVLAMLLVDPALARTQILRAASHQFVEGDVLHWWHPPSGRGVRTRCSDDLLWLPHAVARYIEATGDFGLLDERVPFLRAAELGSEEHDRYAEFPSGNEGSLYEHCLRAFDRAWRLGGHGLPLIGEGDWNDGMNRIGKGGKGESVWLAWFLTATIREFAGIADRAGQIDFGRRWMGRAELLLKAIEEHAWDGAWYVRAFDDMGDPWGSRSSGECQIDSLAQSWAVIAGGGDPERAGIALDSAFERLVRADDGIVRLLDPPFSETPRDPGYIKAYPPGIRENGGQYSHAAAWLGIASAIRGDGKRAKSVFDRLNPILHSFDEEEAERYLIEPYVMAADIGGEAPYLGRGGWSWYTGAAAWSWRLAVEYILGIRLVDGKIVLTPCLPPEWESFKATIRGNGTIELALERGPRNALNVDGKAATHGPIVFPGEGQIRKVEVTLAQESGGAQLANDLLGT